MANTKKPTNDLLDVFDIEALGPDANLQLPDPELVAYYKDSAERKIYITKDIDDSLLLDIRSILRWNAEDEAAKIPVEKRKKIFCYILSYGGQLDVCLAMTDVMHLSKTPIVTVNIGVAASAAGIILLSGTKGYRYCLKNSWALIHQGSGGAQGTYSQVEAQNQNYKKLIEKMKDIILDSTGIDIKTYNRQKSKEWYLYDEDMIKYGVVDHVVEDIADISF